MRRIQIAIPLIMILLVACAAVSGKGRMEKFTLVSESFEYNLLSSDYRDAAKLVHPSVRKGPLDEKHYSNIKIVEYNITHMQVSSDKHEIKQDLELKYFLLNSNRLRTTSHHQVWRYNEADKIWLLHTDLPRFGPGGK